MTNKEMLLIKIEVLELMIFANEAEIEATTQAIKKFTGVTELNGRLLVLNTVNRLLKNKLTDLNAIFESH